MPPARPRAVVVCLTALACLVLGAAAAAGQDAPPPDPDAEATMRFGPLALKSTIALSNIGVDTNVFNQADPEQPQSDFTMTFTPTTNLWLRMGRTWLTGTINVDWVYYNRFTSERSANSNYRIGAARAFNRLELNANAGRLSTRDRPGFEIDARSQRLETALDAEARVRVYSKTYVGVRALRRRHAFDRAAVFRDTLLADELNRTTVATALVVRQEVTPLTTLGAEIGREQERFVTSRDRDADSTRIAGMLNFEPLALISGDAVVAYRRFTPASPDVPPFRGATAAVNLSYRLLGTTRLGFHATRELQPSFDVSQPYYVETGVMGSVQQQVYGPFDVLARAGARGLAYRDRAGAAVLLPGRTDRVRTLSLGAGYRLGTDKRIGMTLDHQQRTSGLEAVRYSGLRFGLSVTYET